MTTTYNAPSRSILSSFIAVRSWPIWLRIIFATAVAVTIPLLLTFLVLGREVAQVDTQNLQAFVQDRGEQQLEALNDLFNRIPDQLEFFTHSDIYGQRVGQLLSARTPSAILAAQSREFLEAQLLDSGLFSDALVFKPSGEVLVAASAPDSDLPAFEEGDSLAGTQLLQAGETADSLGDVQRITIASIEGALVVQIVRPVYISGDLVGYVGGTINQNALFDVLQTGDDFVATRSYLATINDDIIAPRRDRAYAQQSIRLAPVSEALNGISGIREYIVGEDEVVGFFGPAGRDFALITEARAETSFTLTLDEVYGIAVFLVAGGVVFAILLGFLLSQTILQPLQVLRRDMLAFSEGNYDRPVRASEWLDEIGVVGRTFANLRHQIMELLSGQEARIQTRAQYMDATQAVSRFAVTQRDLGVLMDRVVNLLDERFSNIYHAQIFLLDETGTWAVLRASTREVGQILLQRGHRLEVGGMSVIGQVTGDGRVIVARETEESEVHKPNEFLPDTRAELAIPLRVGRRVVGALDLQSLEGDSFSDDQITIFQTMADQIAIAIENARLYQEIRTRMEAVEAITQENTLSNWREFMRIRRQSRLSRHAGVSVQTANSSLRQDAMQNGVPAIGEKTSNDSIPFAVPIRLRGQTLGAVEWELPIDEFNEHKVHLAQEMVNRLALSLENARLFQESEEATSRERLVNEIAARLTGQTNVDEILRTAVRELGQALRAPQVSVQLTLDEQENGAALSNGADDSSAEDQA